MSDMNPFQPQGPFGDLMRNLTQMFANQGTFNLEVAKQFALWAATGGQPEPNVDPATRIKLEELSHLAGMHVSQATGIEPPSDVSVQVVNPSEWAARSLQDWLPLFQVLGKRVSEAPADPAAADFAAGDDPMAKMFGDLPKMIGPFLFGMQAGSMVGDLAKFSLGSYDLPMPRPDGRVMLVGPSIDTFAADWSLDVDEVRLWVCLREITNRTVLARPAVSQRLSRLISDYLDAFTPDTRGIEERLGGVDPTDMAAMQNLFSDPAGLIGEMQSDAQRERQVPLKALLAAITGYTDHIMDVCGKPLMSNYQALSEALVRRRLEDSDGKKMMSQLFGVSLDEATCERGHTFVTGVTERAGEEGLARLWQSERELPTPAEIDAPGLWLARIDLPG